MVRTDLSRSLSRTNYLEASLFHPSAPDPPSREIYANLIIVMRRVALIYIENILMRPDSSRARLRAAPGGGPVTALLINIDTIKRRIARNARFFSASAVIISNIIYISRRSPKINIATPEGVGRPGPCSNAFSARKTRPSRDFLIGRSPTQRSLDEFYRLRVRRGRPQRRCSGDERTRR